MLPIVLASLAFWGPVAGGAFYLVRRYIRAIERRGSDQTELTELRARVAALEDGLDTTRSDVARLEEGHEFTTRLLAERSSNPDRTA
jgi:hypothetical protein